MLGKQPFRHAGGMSACGCSLPKRAWGGTAVALLLAACATAPAPTPTGPARVAIAFDRSGERGAWAEGLAEPATGRAAIPDDPVRVASVSKLIVAIGVMKLVEQGKLDLDRDVAAYLGWNVRNPAFPAQAISLRQLQSHTSSLRDGDDAYVVPLGGSLKQALADPAVWDSTHGPDERYFAYANFNFPVIASAVEMVTGERFDLWMRREVLEPMKLDACFNWPTCSDDAVARAIVLTQDGKPVRDDLHGKRPDCPVFVEEGPCDLNRWKLGENGALFSPQGGLRISARGLARVGQMLLNGGTLDGVRILSAQSVETMLAPAWRFDGRNGSQGGERRASAATAWRPASWRRTSAAPTIRRARAAIGSAMPATPMVCALASGSTASAALASLISSPAWPTSRRPGRAASPRRRKMHFARRCGLRLGAKRWPHAFAALLMSAMGGRLTLSPAKIKGRQPPHGVPLEGRSTLRVACLT